MKLLKSLDKNTKILNISKCGIKGVLDLEDFEHLEELYCSNNKITEIINIPKNIKYLEYPIRSIEYKKILNKNKDIGCYDVVDRLLEEKLTKINKLC